jgi:hypothetical protein
MTTRLDDTQGLDKLLMAHGADAGELTESLKQAILHWVDMEIIGEDDTLDIRKVEWLLGHQAGINETKTKQRATLIHHGYKQNTKEVTE